MEQLLNKASSTLVTFAVRSGFQLASGYAAKTISAVLERVPEKDKQNLLRLKRELQFKIEIVSNAMQLIEMESVKSGIEGLDQLLDLSRDLNDSIEEYQKDLQDIDEQSKGKDLTQDKVNFLRAYMNGLLTKLDKFVPFIQLVLTLNSQTKYQLSQFANVVSPNRFVNAASMISESNQKFDQDGTEDLQVGYDFNVTLYDVFYNHNVAKEDESFIIWKEKFTKCQLKIIRCVNSELDYVYQIKLVEDLDDGRYHDETESEERCFDLRQISKVFFSISGKLLKIDGRSSPVLVLKMNKLSKEELNDPKAYNALDGTKDENFSWCAIGDFEPLPDSDSDSDSDSSEEYKDGDETVEKELEMQNQREPDFPSVKKSPLAILEYLIRLCALQSQDQTPITKASDDRLMSYLADETDFKSQNGTSNLNTKLNSLRI